MYQNGIRQGGHDTDDRYQGMKNGSFYPFL